MIHSEDQWVLCYWCNKHEQRFERHETKESLLVSVQEGLTEGTMNINDLIIYPPYVNLTRNEILSHGIPKELLKHLK